jgi:hypothetical protein
MWLAMTDTSVVDRHDALVRDEPMASVRLCFHCRANAKWAWLHGRAGTRIRKGGRAGAH